MGLFPSWRGPARNGPPGCSLSSAGNCVLNEDCLLPISHIGPQWKNNPLEFCSGIVTCALRLSAGTSQKGKQAPPCSEKETSSLERSLAPWRELVHGQQREGDARAASNCNFLLLGRDSVISSPAVLSCCSQSPRESAPGPFRQTATELYGQPVLVTPSEERDEDITALSAAGAGKARKKKILPGFPNSFAAALRQHFTTNTWQEY